MDIKQISYFMAVAQEGSFSRAAEKINVSQPTLSIAVKKLEEELGAPLFYTFDRRQRLTDEGARLLEGARQLMDVYQKTVEDVKITNERSSGSFTLGLSPLFGTCFFGDLIPSFSARTLSRGSRSQAAYSPSFMADSSWARIVLAWVG